MSLETVLINSDAQLKEFAKQCKQSPYMAIDTEFLREKTYYPLLCLLQIGIQDEIAIIDPFTITNLSLLNEVFVDEQIVKIFHACSQDVEILYQETGVIPKPIFDTQVAAAVLGKSQQASYSSLVSSFCGVTLPKKDSFTDWSQRPLKASQLTYAADDVIYLPQMYEDMKALLCKQNRLHWLDEAFEELSSENKYQTNPYERYKKLKRIGQLSTRQTAAAREFAAWRELIAQKRNVPRKWIVSDEQIVEACRREPRSLDELFMVRGLKKSLSSRDARQVLEAIKKGLSCPDKDLPRIEHKSKNEQNVDMVVDLMNAIARLRATENHIAFQTLAPSSELMKLARGHDEDCELLKGWRYKVVGKELKELVDGHISLRIVDGSLKINHEA